MNNAAKSKTHRCWLRAAAAVFLAAAVGSASASYRYSPVQVDVLSDRHGAFSQYPIHTSGATDEYRAFLEASHGEKYAIRVRNHTADQVGVVVAVDGRNIISGKKSRLRPDERMYVLGPYESATYRGWRTARDRVNRFYFTDAGDSYAAAFNDRSAMGVIAVAAYAPKHRRGHFHSERNHPYSQSPKTGDLSSRPSAPSAEAQKSGPMADAAPGTGYGETRYSPSRRVHFEPQREPLASVFLKYEWRATLCRKDIVDCYHRPTNRFWPRHHDNGYAPAPYSRSYGRR